MGGKSIMSFTRLSDLDDFFFSVLDFITMGFIIADANDKCWTEDELTEYENNLYPVSELENKKKKQENSELAKSLLVLRKNSVKASKYLSKNVERNVRNFLY